MLKDVKKLKNVKNVKIMIRQKHSKCRKREKSRRAGRQGPYFRLLDYLSKSSEVAFFDVFSHFLTFFIIF